MMPEMIIRPWPDELLKGADSVAGHHPPGIVECEQAHQQLKEELGLDHFEGRSWTGLHRHALMTMIAYAFLQSRRLKGIHPV